MDTCGQVLIINHHRLYVKQPDVASGVRNKTPVIHCEHIVMMYTLDFQKKRDLHMTKNICCGKSYVFNVLITNALYIYIYYCVTTCTVYLCCSLVNNGSWSSKISITAKKSTEAGEVKKGSKSWSKRGCTEGLDLHLYCLQGMSRLCRKFIVEEEKKLIQVGYSWLYYFSIMKHAQSCFAGLRLHNLAKIS